MVPFKTFSDQTLRFTCLYLITDLSFSVALTCGKKNLFTIQQFFLLVQRALINDTVDIIHLYTPVGSSLVSYQNCFVKLNLWNKTPKKFKFFFRNFFFLKIFFHRQRRALHPVLNKCYCRQKELIKFMQHYWSDFVPS